MHSAPGVVIVILAVAVNLATAVAVAAVYLLGETEITIGQYVVSLVNNSYLGLGGYILWNMLASRARPGHESWRVVDLIFSLTAFAAINGSAGYVLYHLFQNVKYEWPPIEGAWQLLIVLVVFSWYDLIANQFRNINELRHGALGLGRSIGDTDIYAGERVDVPARLVIDQVLLPSGRVLSIPPRVIDHVPAASAT